MSCTVWPDLKVHAKIALVVRREPSGICRYVHLGTGNYNERTARLYTDFGLFTCAEDFGSDASAFFNTITGYSEPPLFNRLVMAPVGMREKILLLIQQGSRLGPHRSQCGNSGEDEFAGRSENNPGTVRSRQSGRQDPDERARHLLPATRSSRN